MKPVWKLIIITIVAGVVLSLTALSLGGLENGFYVDKTGLHIFKYGEKDLIKELSIGDVIDIDVDVSFSNVEFLNADEFGIEILGDHTQWNWELKNGALKIRHKESQQWSVVNFNFKREADNIKIYVPKDAVLGDVSVEVGSGAVNVGDFFADNVKIYSSFGKTDIYNIKSDTIKIDMSSGKFTGTDLSVKKLEYENSHGSGYLGSTVAEEFIADISSGSFDFQDCTIEKVKMDNSLGSINGKELFTSNIDIDVSSGSVNLDGAFSGETKIKASLGSVKVFTSMPKEDYSYSMDVSLGGIILDNEKMGSKTSIKSDNVSENNLELHVSSGDIEVNFGK